MSNVTRALEGACLKGDVSKVSVLNFNRNDTQRVRRFHVRKVQRSTASRLSRCLRISIRRERSKHEHRRRVLVRLKYSAHSFD